MPFLLGFEQHPYDSRDRDSQLTGDLATGLRHLRDRGLRTVMLYTEATNVRAVKLYGRFGFTEFTTDTQYARN